MAAKNNVFTDKETINWFKASKALNVAKQGLTDFLDKQLQNVHAALGKCCGNCPIEKLIPCPTNPYCNKRKRNYCPFHKSQKPQPCPTCDHVKQNIILQHRYSGPSWRNTRAENWAQDYWEIGKCFLPPDGYSHVCSVQESDFNGVISIMLNCLHFQTCLSSSCLSPPPPDKQCPLEKVRQIGRDVRHTSDNKVTDADQQDYFQTLSTLLADPNCLQHDPSATIACTTLRDIQLQNDHMSIEELEEYERGKADFRRNLIQFYTTKMNTVSVSPLWEGCDKPVCDIFVTPKLISIIIEKDGSRTKTNHTIQQYKDIFYNDKKLNRVLIEGDPGTGKSTFLIKLALDWCEAVLLHNPIHLSTFSDVDTLKDFQFLFTFH
ncbi:uncharacterized protein LOC127837486 [Dreissena polymorpha]|uniref:uncharacterized protein LOC127837486 n=1 Tax=Dreissena polymorpha TaxID=45954 RepID=UPI0022642C72|nr:uncharacterized protein LOC127837486 [Dreissena polymorpha]